MGVRFVDIGGIVNLQGLNILFIICFFSKHRGNCMVHWYRQSACQRVLIVFLYFLLPLDEVLSLNNSLLNGLINCLRHMQLHIKDTIDRSNWASYLDLNLEIDNGSCLVSKLYDKKDVFSDLQNKCIYFSTVTRGIVHVVVFTIDYCHVFVFITNTFFHWWMIFVYLYMGMSTCIAWFFR